MATGNFSKCLARILVYEGGNDDDPRDPGGRTSRGILQSEYERWLKRSGKWSTVTDRDVWRAADVDIAQIYRENYWDRMHCEELPAGIDLVIFDSGINSGVAQAAKWAQRACGIAVDGDFGPETRHALQSSSDNDRLAAEILKRRLAMLQALSTWKFYGKGWSARVANVQKIAQAWASGSVGPDPVIVEPLGGDRKADVGDIRRPLIPVGATEIAQGASAAGTMAGGAASQIQPVAAMFPERIGAWVLGIAGALTVAAIVANQVSTFAQRRADAARNAEAAVEVDLTADDVAMPVAVDAAVGAATVQVPAG